MKVFTSRYSYERFLPCWAWMCAHQFDYREIWMSKFSGWQKADFGSFVRKSFFWRVVNTSRELPLDELFIYYDSVLYWCDNPSFQRSSWVEENGNIGMTEMCRTITYPQRDSKSIKFRFNADLSGFNTILYGRLL